MLFVVSNLKDSQSKNKSSIMVLKIAKRNNEKIIWISKWLRVECESLIKCHTIIIYIYKKKWFINVDNILYIPVEWGKAQTNWW